MPISQVFLSNTFNEFRQTTNLVIDEINALTNGTGVLVVDGTTPLTGTFTIDGNLVVTGETTTVVSSTLSVQDNMIYLNYADGPFTITNVTDTGTAVTYTIDSEIENTDFQVGWTAVITGVNPSAYNISGLIDSIDTGANSFTILSTATGTYVNGGTVTAKASANVDLGWAGGYQTSPTDINTYAHAGIFRDATDGVFKIYEGYTLEPDAQVNIDTTHSSFSYASVAGKTFTSNNVITDDVVTDGNFVIGKLYNITVEGNTVWTEVGATTGSLGEQFEATATGSNSPGTGTAREAEYETTAITISSDFGDLVAQRTYIDFVFTDDNSNETPQVRIGAQVGDNDKNADGIIEEGHGAFVIYTNNADTGAGAAGASLVERMRVDHLGNVGIGTNNPATALDVVGDINVVGDITLGDTNPTITFNDSSLTNLSHTISSSSDNLRISVDTNDVDAGSKLEIFDNGTEVARFSVGELDVTGTVVADGLTVQSAGTIQLTQNTAAAGDLLGRIEFHDEDAVTGDGGVVRLEAIRGADVDAPDFQIISTTNGGVLTPRLFLDSATGNIGIGTVSPNERLVVEESVNDAGPAIAIQNSYSLAGSINERNDLQFRFYNIGATQFSSGAMIRSQKTEDWTVNANASAELSFWTRENNSLTQRMTITDTGNVGIGTDSPGRLVDLKVSDNNDGARLRLRSASAIDNYPTIGSVEFYSDDGSTNSSGIVGSIDVEGIGTWNGASNNAAMTFNLIQGLAGTTSPVEAMRISSAGNVGIGTSSPPEVFAIGATSSVAGFSIGSGDTQAFLRYNNYFSGTAQVSDATKGTASISLGRSSDGVITFNTAAAGAGVPTEAMRINSSRQVGIGRSPANKALEVEGTTTNYNTMLVADSASGTTGTGGGIGFQSDQGTGISVLVSAIQGIKENSTSEDQSGALVFAVKSPSPHTMDEAMRITSSGQVGIGTNTPDGKLHIENTSGTSTEMYIAQQKTYGASTGTAERAKLILSISEATQTASARPFAEFSARTIDESSSSAGALDIGVRSGGAITNVLTLDNNQAATFAGTISSGAITVETNTEPKILVTPSSNSGQNATIEIRGAKTSPALGHEVAVLSLSSYDDDIPEVKELARIASKTVVGSDTDLNSQKLSFQHRVSGALSEGMYLYNNDLIVPNGNVGIGTTSPNNRIDAVEAQDTVANVLANGTYVAKFTGDTTYTTGASQGVLIGGVDGSLRGVALVAEAQSVLNDHNFIIAVSGTSATPTERMRIDSSGRVGIGTDGPTFKLEVDAAADATDGILVTNTNTNSASRAALDLQSDGAKLSLYSTSSTYNGVPGWANSGIITSPANTSGGIKLNAQSNSIYFQTRSGSVGARNTGTKWSIDTAGDFLASGYGDVVGSETLTTFFRRTDYNHGRIYAEEMVLSHAPEQDHVTHPYLMNDLANFVQRGGTFTKHGVDNVTAGAIRNVFRPNAKNISASASEYLVGISNATFNTTYIEYTTSENHNLYAGEKVTVSGTLDNLSGSTFDVTDATVLADSLSANTFRVAASGITTTWASAGEATTQRYVITLSDLPAALTYGGHYGISFGTKDTFHPEEVKVEVSNNNESSYTTVVDYFNVVGSIASATFASDYIEYTTVAAHGLVAGQSVLVDGTVDSSSGSSYDKTATVAVRSDGLTATAFRVSSSDPGTTHTANTGVVRAGDQERTLTSYVGYFSAGASAPTHIRYTIGRPKNSSTRLTNLYAYNYNSNGMDDYFISEGGEIGGNGIIETGNGATASVNTTTIFTYDAASTSGADIVVTATDTVTDERHIMKMLITHDANNTAATATQYGSVFTNGELADFDVSISGADVIVTATAYSTNSTTYKIMGHLLTN